MVTIADVTNSNSGDRHLNLSAAKVDQFVTSFANERTRLLRSVRTIHFPEEAVDRLVDVAEAR